MLAPCLEQTGTLTLLNTYKCMNNATYMYYLTSTIKYYSGVVKVICKSSTRIIHCIAQQKASFIQNNLTDRGTEILSELEQLVIGSKLNTCNKQTKLSLFFGQKGLQSNTIGGKGLVGGISGKTNDNMIS